MAGTKPDDAGGADAAAAALWEAAGDAMAWKASIHGHAAWTARRRGWAAKAESDNAVGRAAEAAGRAVDAQGRMDVEALERAAGMLREAAKMLARASRAFARSSRLHKRTGAAQKRASRAYGRGADPAHAKEARRWAAGSRGDAQTAASHAAGMRRAARTRARDAAELDATAARWSAAGGNALIVGAESLPSVQADVLEGARQARAESDSMEGRMEKLERDAADIRRLAAETVRRSAAGAAGAAEAAAGEIGRAHV